LFACVYALLFFVVSKLLAVLAVFSFVSHEEKKFDLFSFLLRGTDCDDDSMTSSSSFPLPSFSAFTIIYLPGVFGFHPRAN